eukprot:gene3220-6365_t
MSTELDDNNLPTFREEIDNMIDSFLKPDISTGLPKVNVDPRVLMENAHILVKGRIYEEVIEQRINDKLNAAEIDAIKELDNSLRGFISTERKARARLKLNYILEGATSNRLEDAIRTLSESDEIDDALLLYTDSLVSKVMLRAGGVSALADEEGEETLQGGSKATVDLLRMVQRRLRVELQLEADGRDELRLLAKLVAEDQLEVRERELRQSLLRVEDLELFVSLLEGAITHLSSTSSTLTPTSDGNGNSRTSSSPYGSSTTASAPGTLERLRDIRVSVGRVEDMLRTGLRDQDLFSTSPEDYLQ